MTAFGLTATQRWQFTSQRALSFGGSVEGRRYDHQSYRNGPIASLNLRWEDAIDLRSSYTLGASVIRARPDQGHLRYRGLTLSAGASRRFDQFGWLGVFGRIGLRNYDETFPALSAPRSDHFASIGLSATPYGVELWGLSPQLSCEIGQTWSNVALYEYSSADCQLGLVRRF